MHSFSAPVSWRVPVDNGSHTTNSIIESSGFIHFASGNHDLKGTFDHDGLLRFGSGSVTFNNAFTPSGIVTNTSATLTFNVPQSFDDFEFIDGTIAGPANVTFTGDVNLRSVTMSGTGRTIFATNANVRTLTAGGISFGRPVDNYGNFTVVQKRGITVTREFRNQPSGTFTIDDGLDFSWNGGTPLVVNAGTMNKNGTNEFTIFSVPFANTGVLNLNRGSPTPPFGRNRPASTAVQFAVLRPTPSSVP